MHTAVFACLNPAPAGAAWKAPLEARILNVVDRIPDTPVLPPPKQTQESMQQAGAALAPKPAPAPAEQPGAPRGSLAHADAATLVAVPEAPKYYTSQEVDVRATPAQLLTRPLSDKSLALGRLVAVKLRIYINEAGGIDRLEPIEADGSYDAGILDEFMREARFKPAEKNGVPVKSQKLIEITFSP